MTTIADMEKRKPGRPPADNPLRMKCIRVTDEDWAAYRAAAEINGVELSAWIRGVLGRAAKRAGKPRTDGAQSQS